MLYSMYIRHLTATYSTSQTGKDTDLLYIKVGICNVQKYVVHETLHHSYSQLWAINIWIQYTVLLG